METCHHCGTVLPKTPGARYCPNCGEMSTPTPAAVSDPTQAFAAVGVSGQGGPAASPERGMTWELPAQSQQEATQPFPTQPVPAQSAPPEPDPYEGLFRPEGGAARANPNATQVMPLVPDDFGRSEYDHPAYDQPIDYQAGGGGAYRDPYGGEYADDYPGDHPGEAGKGARANRGTKIAVAAAAGAVLVIVVSLITLGGGSSTPSAGPANAPGSVTTPSATASSSSPQAVASPPATSAPSSSSASPTQHTPGLLQLGDSGPEVKWLQNRLHQLGLYNGPISGVFDGPTQSAVAAFQGRAHPSDPSGVVGRSTKTALIAAGSKPTLTAQLPGMVGGPFGGGDKHHKGGGSAADIKRLQEALAVALGSTVKATGQFDADTFAAVVQYQSAMHLMPDGIVNGPVWSALQEGKITG